jgi:hypothetical protein
MRHAVLHFSTCNGSLNEIKGMNGESTYKPARQDWLSQE